MEWEAYSIPGTEVFRVPDREMMAKKMLILDDDYRVRWHWPTFLSP